MTNSIVIDFLYYCFVFSDDPPTPEELNKNLAIMEMKKINAAKLDEHFSNGKLKETQNISGIKSFPTHDGYETSPGKDKEKE